MSKSIEFRVFNRNNENRVKVYIGDHSVEFTCYTFGNKPYEIADEIEKVVALKLFKDRLLKELYTDLSAYCADYGYEYVNPTIKLCNNFHEFKYGNFADLSAPLYVNYG